MANLKDSLGNVILEPGQVRARWVEHFEAVLNPRSVVTGVVPKLKARSVKEKRALDHLSRKPSLDEVEAMVGRLRSGKAASPVDEIVPEFFKDGGQVLTMWLTDIIQQIWHEEVAPKDWRDSTLCPLFKNKGSARDCDNYRGITLLAVASKVLAL